MLYDDGIEGIVKQQIEKLNRIKNDISLISSSSMNNEKEKINNDIIKLKEAASPLELLFTLKNSPLKMYYQTIRLAAGLGLLIFSNFIHKNKGIFFVSSLKNIYNNLIKDIKVCSDYPAIPIGTSYSITFPIKLNELISSLSIENYTNSKQTSPIDSFQELFNADYYDIGTISNINDVACRNGEKCLKKIKIEKKDLEKKIYNFFLQDSNNITSCKNCNKFNNFILILELEDELKSIDPSDLFRLLGCVQRTTIFPAVIVYNVNENVVKNLLNILEIYEKTTGIAWNSKQYVLIYYSHLRNLTQKTEYHTALIGDEKISSIKKINERILKYNIGNNLFKDIMIEKALIENKKIDNPLFIHDNNLLPFDVLLTKNNHTLFEWNIISHLMVKAEKNGFRYTDIHIKLGSKIHVNEFYYAKRLFQHSYYALRFGFLAAKYFNNKIKKDEKVIIFSYALYSELLANTCVNLLSSKNKSTKNISHFIIKDYESQALADPAIEDYINNVKHFFLIIPIASTLSTLTKIKSQLYNLNKKSLIEFENHPLNFIVVGHKSTDLITDSKGNVTDKIAQRFWDKIDKTNRLIYIKNKPEDTQRYSIFLEAEWCLPENCKSCMPIDEDKETPLFFADSKSITPSLKLNYPKGKNKNHSCDIFFDEESYDTARSNLKGIVTPEMIYYDHIVRGNNHYLFYVDSTLFFRKNKENITRWLTQIKNNIHNKFTSNKENLLDYTNYLVAPTHRSNSSFIHLVNTIVFSGTATIINCDNKENTIIINDDVFEKNPKKQFFFIDDALCSGQTFLKLHDMIDGFTGCFVLINRLKANKEKLLCKKISNIFSFVNIEAPVIRQQDEECYLCKRKKLNYKILKNSVLDSTRNNYIDEERLFIKNIEDLINSRRSEKAYNQSLKDLEILFIKKIDKNILKNKIETKLNEFIKIAPVYDLKRKYLDRLKSTHILYQKFLTEEIQKYFEKNYTFDDLYKEICEPYSKFVGNSMKLSSDIKKVNLIKILCRPYFSDYLKIRKTILNWLIKEFNTTTQFFNKSDVNENGISFAIDKFRYLKQIIKRLAYLQSNFLLRHDTLNKIYYLLDSYTSIWKKSFNEEEKKLSDEIYKIKNDLIEINLLLLQTNFGDKETVATPSKFQSKISDLYTYVIKLSTLRKLQKSLKNFNLYYVNCVKEVIWDDDSRSLVFDNELDKIQNAFDTNKLKDKSFEYTSLLKMLRIENVNILASFLDWIVNNYIDISKSLSFKINSFENDINIFLDHLNEEIFFHYKFQPLNSFLKCFYLEDLKMNTDFTNKILPLIFIKYSLKENGQDISPQCKTDKLNYILFLLCKVININSDPNNGDGGAYCIANCTPREKKGSHLFYYEIANLMNSYDLFSSNNYFNWADQEFNNFSKQMIDGYSTDSSLPWSNIEIIKEAEEWKSYAGRVKEFDKYIEHVTHKSPNGEKKYFFFLRLSILDEKKHKASQMDVYKKTGTGVIVFYSNNKNFLSSIELRYLMLLKNEISAFVHENFSNYAFKSWFEELFNKKINAGLTSHGTDDELNLLSKLLNSKGLLDDKTNFMIQLLKSKFFYYRENIDSENIKKLFKINKPIKKSRIKEIAKMIADLVYNNAEISNFDCNHQETGTIKINVNVQETDEIQKRQKEEGHAMYFCNLNLIEFTLFELMRNSKKHITSFNIPEITINLNFVSKDSKIFLEYENLSSEKIDLDLFRKINTLGFNKLGRGLYICDYIWKKTKQTKLKFNLKNERLITIIPFGE